MGKKQKAAFLAGYEQGHRDGFGADRAEASREFEEQMAWDAYREGSLPAPLPREADERANLDPAVQAAFAKASKREFDAELTALFNKYGQGAEYLAAYRAVIDAETPDDMRYAAIRFGEIVREAREADAK